MTDATGRTDAALGAPSTNGRQADPTQKAFIHTGGAFILDQPQDLQIRWGRGGEVLWSNGESLMVAAPTGVGKTTLAGELIAALAGITTQVLGYPVMPAGKVLYLAMDRPRQIRRALGRRFTEADRQALDSKVIFREGPLPKDLVKDPEQLLNLALEHEADVLVVDSLKDAAAKLSEDETGGAVNRAVQLCNVHNIDTLVQHHQRKEGDKKPDKLSDVYGSTWLTAGAGSVILLWGEASAEQVELRHLKAPAEPIGPLHVEHDHLYGTCTVVKGFDLLQCIKQRGAAGITVSEAAQAEHEAPQRSGNAAWKRTERRLRSLEKQGLLVVRGQGRSGGGTFAEARYYLAAKP